MKAWRTAAAVMLAAVACGARSLAEPSSTPTNRDAACPVADPWSLDDAARQQSACRDRICLNGYWQFWPDDNNGRIPDNQTGWCWLKAPGSWPSSHRWGLFPYPFVPVMSERWSKDLPIDVNRGNWHSANNQAGEPIPFDRVEQAWYQRRLTPPRSWQGRRILLNAEYVERHAQVYVDGALAGALDWPYGELDLTRFLTVGREAVLSLRLTGTGGGLRGLAGDVFLEARPLGPTLRDVYLTPSVRRETLTMRGGIYTAGTGEGFQVAGEAVLDGKTVFAFAPRPVHPSTGGTFSVTVPWRNAAPWDFDNPRLHQVRIRLLKGKGPPLDETLPITLGFREFGIAGKEFILNGTPVHFRSAFYKPIGASLGLADARTVERVVTRLRALGYNLLVSSIYSAGPGQLHYPRQLLETCDALGMAVQLQLNKATQFMTYTEKDGWKLPDDGLTRWEEAVRPQIISQRQHPSLFFWAANANIFAGPEKANPRDWILPERPTQVMTGWDTFTRILTVSDAAIRAMDGDRPIITLGNGNHGDVISSYVYPNFYPRQQQRELPSLWAEKGLKPLMIAEWGNPADISFSSHRENKPRWPDLGFHAEPMPAEYSAIFDGDSAYTLDAAGQTLYGRLPQLHAQPFSIYHWTRQQAVRFEMHQSFFKTKIDCIREVLPTWRARGVSAIGILETYEYRQRAQTEHEYRVNPDRLTDLKSPGIKPDYHPWFEAALTHPEADRYFELTAHGEALREGFAPVLGFIGGHPQQDGGIANRTATAITSGRLPCSLIVVNDTRHPVRLSAHWRLGLEGAVIATGSTRWTVAPGTSTVEPLDLQVPDRPGALRLEAFFDGENRQWEDQRSWQVLGPPPSRAETGLAVYDPVGLTTQALQRLGLPFTMLARTDALPEAARLLLIGYRTLDTTNALPFVQEAARRGLNTLILAQEAGVTAARLGFRYTDVAAQQLTLRRPQAEETAGVSQAAMRNWAGSSKLYEPYPDMTTRHHYAAPLTDWLGFKNPRMYRWGNTGSLASVLPEKPVTAGFAYLVDGHYDTRYFGLARIMSGTSTVWYCALDLVGRTIPDPAADRLLVNLVRIGLDHHSDRPPPCRSIGADAAGWATPMRLTAQPVTNAAALPPRGILLAGPAAIALLEPASLGRAVEQGLRVLAVGWDQESLRQLTGEAVKTERRSVIGEPALLNPPAALDGLGPADLFWHGPLACEAIAAIHEAKVATDRLTSYWTPFGTLGWVRRGYGKVVMVQPTPDVAVPAWQERAPDKLLRVIATVLSNWSAPVREATLLRYLAEPPTPGEKRWESGYYSRPTQATDDPMRWQSW